MQCIWCGEDSAGKQSVEHIVPEAIGCPPGFVLANGEVCTKCNNWFGHIDQALIADMEMFAALAGVPRKRSGAGIFSYGNIRARTIDGHLSYFINMDPKPVRLIDGMQLGGYKGRDRDVAATMTREADKVKVDFSVDFGRNINVRRAIFKIAINWVARELGSIAAREIVESDIGKFVKSGVPDCSIILVSPSSEPKKYQHKFSRIWRSTSGGLVCDFRLGHIEFIVDLQQGQSSFELICSKMYEAYGAIGWTTLPPTWKPPDQKCSA